MAFKIDDIRNLLEEDKIQWSGHVLARMQQREIRVADVIETISSGEIIEYYESDYPYPSCLILGSSKDGKKLHIVCALGKGSMWMITAYYPNTIEWLEDLKTRRR
ncbi:MAG TPA: DUF4258 domain-containing protein [Epulopiscium sp.]|nr:DUF4258 domain-containing protein [Candidatus Epulonipiscium sp.]